jgi:hypothetical protein
MQKFNFLRVVLLLLPIILLLNCGGDVKVSIEEREIRFEDINGQWTLIRIDTITSKQSLEVNKNDNSMMVEYETSEIKPVNGILKCVHLCPTSYPKKEIEFANDSVFEYVFPTHIRSSNELKIVDNKVDLKGINSIWYKAEWDTNLELKLEKDTLMIEYLEQTGLYLSEVYTRNSFDKDLVGLLRAYRHNLPIAHGKYALVHYEFKSVDYDSPFEHYHSFPHTVPETLEFSKADLLQILKDEYEFEMLTDGVLKPYDLSWSWGNRFWVSPKEWYEGPDTSAFMIYDKVE